MREERLPSEQAASKVSVNQLLSPKHMFWAQNGAYGPTGWFHWPLTLYTLSD
jgi:hypothetical protein